MSIYYLVARPETMVAIVKTGKLPPNLPPWAHQDHLFCSKLVAECLAPYKGPFHQLFILELDLPDQHEISDAFKVLDAVETTAIQCIMVYSERGYKLLNGLFNKTCSKPIIIQPELYAVSSSLNPKRPLTHFFTKTSNIETQVTEKKARTQPALLSSNYSIKSNQKSKESNPIVVERLGSYDEHLHILQVAFKEANTSILLTSYSVTQEHLKKAGLYTLIPQAIARGVKIYIYYNDQQDIEPSVLQFLKEQTVVLAYTYTHSKILAVDRHFVAAGSFNWLSGIDARYHPSEEGTLTLRGKEVCELLIEDFWKYIKHYRNEQFGREARVERFEQNDENMASLIYKIDDENEISYLPVLEEHSGFLQESFERAQKRIIVCSPFISAAREYEEDVDYGLLKQTLARGVDIYFVCASESPQLNQFKTFLARLASPKLQVVTVPDMHLKTIIVDEDTLAEGSFNWLSATRNRESEYHNHEQTLVIQGGKAANLIQHFFTTRVGKAVLQNMCNESKEDHTQKIIPRIAM